MITTQKKKKKDPSIATKSFVAINHYCNGKDFVVNCCNKVWDKDGIIALDGIALIQI